MSVDIRRPRESARQCRNEKGNLNNDVMVKVYGKSTRLSGGENQKGIMANETGALCSEQR